MDFEELKKELTKIKRQESLLQARMARTKNLYIQQHAPIKCLRMYERIRICLRVTEESRKRMTEKERAMKKNQAGHEYSVEGCFSGWLLDEDRNGEIIPCLFTSKYYSKYDEIYCIESIDQIEGCCSKCRKYKDGYCYMAGGMTISKSCATRKVGKDDYTCPHYEELTELWTLDGKRHMPNVTHLKHSKEYRIYSLNWLYYTKYTEDEIEKYYKKSND